MDGASSIASSETLEQAQSRHRKEARELQGRITNKKKNATKKTRKGVNDECAEMERQMRDRHAEELRRISGEAGDDDAGNNNNNNNNKNNNDDDDDTRTRYNEDDAPEARVDAAAFAEKMRALGVEDLAARPPQNPTSEREGDISSGGNGGGGGGGGGGGAAGKKRNRQKERLARRAAEQEAAATAAEQEASSMTDHRGAEREKMRGEFDRNGLVEEEIRPDGHCLFSAVADQLQQRGVAPGGGGGGGGEGDAGDAGDAGEAEPGYKAVRRRAAGYIGEHGDDFAGFLEEDLESYVRKIRDTAEWGGQLELLAVANVYGVEIRVVQDGRTEVIRPTETTATATEGEDDEKKRIWLAYYRHGYGLGEHYNSLRTKA